VQVTTITGACAPLVRWVGGLSAGAPILSAGATRGIEWGDYYFVPVTNLSPEPYGVLKPLPVLVECSGEEHEWIATLLEVNLCSSGDNPVAAVENLKTYMLDIYDTLAEDDPRNLGPEPLRQLRLLREYLVRRPDVEQG